MKRSVRHQFRGILSPVKENGYMGRWYNPVLVCMCCYRPYMKMRQGEGAITVVSGLFCSVALDGERLDLPFRVVVFVTECMSSLVS